MKFLPKILFRKDESFEYAEKIENLIKQSNKQEKHMIKNVKEWPGGLMTIEIIEAKNIVDHESKCLFYCKLLHNGNGKKQKFGTVSIIV